MKKWCIGLILVSLAINLFCVGYVQLQPNGAAETELHDEPVVCRLTKFGSPSRLSVRPFFDVRKPQVPVEMKNVRQPISFQTLSSPALGAVVEEGNDTEER
jgi:hypothetical protein